MRKVDLMSKPNKALMRLKTKFGLVKGHNSHLCIFGLERKRDTD